MGTCVLSVFGKTDGLIDLTFLGFSHPPAGCDVEWVSSLIIPESASWNTDLISSLFPPCKEALILSVPLSGILPPDHLMWHYDSKGLFSVKSAYKVAISLRDLASPSNQSTLETSTWNKIWRALVPRKVKICAWKACLNILPTHSNLEKKKGGGGQYLCFV